MIDYTIMEYNFETKKYTTIGLAQGVDAAAAKKAYINKHGWEPKEGVFLFAKPPLCR